MGTPRPAPAKPLSARLPAQPAGGLIRLSGWRDWRFSQRLVSDPDQRTLESLEAISQYVTAMPGTVNHVYYNLSDWEIWVRHIVDAAFLRAWLCHPHFRMIK